jgi:hypothetical protein
MLTYFKKQLMNKSMMLIKILFLFTCVAFITSCNKETKSEVEIYNNNFEAADLKYIDNGFIELYNGTHVLGRYNTSSFALALSDLPKHDLITISFDLYIHDSWDGNKLGIDSVDGPDVWKLLIDHNTYINTTFSNSPCAAGTFCPPQSYPNNYPNNNRSPKTGSFQANLPPVCNLTSTTTLYKIEKTVNHTSSTLLLQCLDQLIQKNAPDKKCDESWSIDNLKIKVIGL